MYLDTSCNQGCQGHGTFLWDTLHNFVCRSYWPILPGTRCRMHCLVVWISCHLDRQGRLRLLLNCTCQVGTLYNSLIVFHYRCLSSLVKTLQKRLWTDLLSILYNCQNQSHQRSCQVHRKSKCCFLQSSRCQAHMDHRQLHRCLP